MLYIDRQWCFLNPLQEIKSKKRTLLEISCLFCYSYYRNKTFLYKEFTLKIKVLSYTIIFALLFFPVPGPANSFCRDVFWSYVQQKEWENTQFNLPRNEVEALLKNGRRFESQNGLGCNGPQRALSSNPTAMGRAACHHIRLPRAPSNLALNASRDGAPTTSPGSCASASPTSQ